VTEDLRERTDEQPARPRRRALRFGAWLVAVLVLATTGVVVTVVANRDHWLDRDRQVTLHQLNLLGRPAGFRTAKALPSDPGPSGWDAAAGLGRRYYDGELVPWKMSKAVDYWLGRGGVLTSNGPRESQSCQLIDVAGLQFGCGNFYRETPQWRVWVALSGPHWPNGPAPAGDKPTPVHLMVVVQQKRTLSQSFAYLPSVTSPGLTSALPRGAVRTVMSLSGPAAKTLDLDGATFGPAGQLVTAGTGQPVVLPAARGAAARRLTYTAWPSFAREFDAAQRPLSADAARIDQNGSLWVHYRDLGLRRLDVDGHASNLMGLADADGAAFDGPAWLEDPIRPGTPLAVSADGTAWAATGFLLRLRDGKAHLMNVKPTGIRTVTSDGHDGVYFATSTRLFHLPRVGVATALPGAFHDVSSLAVAKDGSLFVLDKGRLLQVVKGHAHVVAGDGSWAASDDDRGMCSSPVGDIAARMPVSAIYHVIASPLGGAYLAGCERLVQVGY
jgi:hypothetical protein